MALVSLGSALFTLNSTFGFVEGPMNWDASRVSAAIPSGVGFLGGGLIVKSTDVDPITGDRHHLVQGITTAAATWLSAAVGIRYLVHERPDVVIYVQIVVKCLLLGALKRGISCGGGMYFVACFATALNLSLLRFGPRAAPSEEDGSAPSAPVIQSEPEFVKSSGSELTTLIGKDIEEGTAGKKRCSSYGGASQRYRPSLM